MNADQLADRAPRVTLEQQISAVERELRMRHRVYGRWVESGKMTQDEADRGLIEMTAVLGTLRRQPKRQGSLI